MACGITDPVGCVGDVFGGAARSVADSAFSAIAHDFGQAADSVVNWLWRQISAATDRVARRARVRHRPGHHRRHSRRPSGSGCSSSRWSSRCCAASRAGWLGPGAGLLVAFVAGAAAIAVVDLLLAAIDALSAGVVQVATGGSINQMGVRISRRHALSSVSNPAAVILLSLVVVAATVVVWAALMVRKLLIIVAAVFAPIAFAGSLADITGGVGAAMDRDHGRTGRVQADPGHHLHRRPRGARRRRRRVPQDGSRACHPEPHPDRHRRADPGHGRLRPLAGHQARPLRRRLLPHHPRPRRSGPCRRRHRRRCAPADRSHGLQAPRPSRAASPNGQAGASEDGAGGTNRDHRDATAASGVARPRPHSSQGAGGSGELACRRRSRRSGRRRGDRGQAHRRRGDHLRGSSLGRRLPRRPPSKQSPARTVRHLPPTKDRSD